ncbi:MAG: long-chain-fatty-acid--CoA ligase [Alphaproteobacteria bacterium]|nr:MAG: long-chain-fatty-acid--CoA ligase [Alphaproteobacteria bacterium]
MSDSQTLRDRLDRLADHGERPAVLAFGEDGDARTLSFRELSDGTRRLAAGLIASGVGRGDTVAICAPNSAGWIIAALGIIRAGAVVAPLDMRLDSRTLADEIRRSGSRLIFTSAKLRDVVAEAGGGDGVPRIVLLDGDGSSADGRSWTGLPAADTGEPPVPAPNDGAALFFTSGTTGSPKAVPLTHRNLLSNVDGLLEAGLISGRERALLPLPLHHVYPFTVGMLAPLLGGATVVLPAGIAGPDIQHALRDGGATAVIGIPRLLEALLAAIQRRVASGGRIAEAVFGALLGLSVRLRRRLGWRAGRVLFGPLRRAAAPQLRLFASGGAPLDPEVAWALEGLGWEVLSGYGLTETSPIISFNRRGANRIGTVGQPLAGFEIRIDRPDETGLGEILVRGPGLFAGYKDDPEATSEAFAEGGWFRTKDLGAVEDGFLRIGARANETIVLGAGKKVFPEEVEAVLLKSPLLHEVAVLGRDGRLVALVVPDAAALRAQGSADAGQADAGEAIGAELRRLGRDLPPHQRVGDFAVTRNPLPRTTLRKLRRHLLPEIYAQAKSGVGRGQAAEELSAADRALLEADTARRAWDWLKRRYPDKPVTMDAELQSDLGIDSLDLTALTLELQDEVGVRLGESSLSRVVTLRDLLEEILAAEQGGEEPAGTGPTPEQLRWLDPPGAMIQLLGAALFGLNWLLLRLLFRLRVEGADRAPVRGPCILAPNHASFLDGFALAGALRLSQARETYWAGFTAFLFRTAPQRLFSRIIHALPIDPARAPVSSLALGEEAVRRGRILVWFPEGARTRTGALQKLMPGIGRIVAATGVPVVPVHIAGTFEAWPIDRKYPRLRPVRVRFGEALTPEQLAIGAGEEEDSAAADRVTAALQERLAQLAAEDGAAARPG